MKKTGSVRTEKDGVTKRRGQVSTFDIHQILDYVITMARPLRLNFENAIYHITARGNRQENIYYTDRDKALFLDKSSETFRKYGFVCYAYCLMDNHYHLFVKTPHANLTQGMHYLNTSYANWFKAKHKIAGPIFQGRYKSLLVDADNYSLILTAYIHLNPMRACVVKNLSDFKWSSYRDYLGLEKSLERLEPDFILNQLDRNPRQAVKKYQAFIKQNFQMSSPFLGSYRGVALGSKDYLEKIQAKIKYVGTNREISATKIDTFFSAEAIIQEINQRFAMSKDEVFAKQRGNIFRQLTIYLIKKYTSLSLQEIGKLSGMDYTAVSQSCKRFGQKIKKDKQIYQLTKTVEASLLSMSNVET